MYISSVYSEFNHLFIFSLISNFKLYKNSYKFVKNDKCMKYDVGFFFAFACGQLLFHHYTWHFKAFISLPLHLLPQVIVFLKSRSPFGLFSNSM